MRIRYIHIAVLLVMTVAVRASAQGAVAEHDAGAGAAVAATEGVVVPTGVPLHIQVTKTAHLHKGAAVSGVLTTPIYVRDRLVLPVGSPVSGTVTEYAPVDHIVREQALLNGDVTPLHDPVVDFTSVHLVGMNEDVPLDTRAQIRETKLVRFVSVKKESLIHKAIAAAKARVHDVYVAFTGAE